MLVYNPAQVKAVKTLVIASASVVIVAGAVYGGYLYGHKTGYSSSQTAANKQIAALKKQDANDKASANKYKQLMWNAIDTSLPNKTTPQSLNCTSYSYGIDNNRTSTTCN